MASATGQTFDALVAKGLAQMHGPGEHQCFITNDFAGTMSMMYLTPDKPYQGQFVVRLRERWHLMHRPGGRHPKAVKPGHQLLLMAG